MKCALLPAYFLCTDALFKIFRARKVYRRAPVPFEGLFGSAMVRLIVSGGCGWASSNGVNFRLLELWVPSWLGSDDLSVEVGLIFSMGVITVSVWLVSFDTPFAPDECVLIGDPRASSSSVLLSSISANQGIAKMSFISSHMVHEKLQGEVIHFTE